MTTPPLPKAFAHLMASQNADSIYYADLFKINDKIWMITGTGKSKAASIASHHNRADSIARDSVAIIKNSNVLYGRYDPGAVDPVHMHDYHALYKIDFIAHCLNDIQSQNFYLDKPLEIIKIDNRSLANFIMGHQYPAFMAKHFFSTDQYFWLISHSRRFDRFLELTNDIISTQFIVIPWMENIEKRALLYKEIIDI